MVELRDAAPADAHAVAALIVRSWRAGYRGLIADDALAGMSVHDREELWSHALTTRPARTRFVVATLEDAVVGVAAAGPPLVPDDRADPSLGDLYALYLDPELWRRGIGTRLHSAALDRLRSCGFTHAGLWVLEGNERALRFYAHHGWTDAGRTRLDRGPGGVELHERRLVRDLGDDAITLATDELREVAGFAAACAETVLAVFEAALPGDARPREAIAAARAFARGGERGKALRDTAWAALRAARDADDPAAEQAARAATAAAGAAYLHPLARADQVKHILGAAAHAARAVELVEGEAAAAEHLEQARRRANPVVVDVLARYPVAPGGGGRVGQLVRDLDAALRP